MEIVFADDCIVALEQFYDIVDNALKREALTAENEEKLEELRKNLPEKAKQFYSAVDMSVPGEGFQKILDLTPNLAAVATLTGFQRRNLLDLWHFQFLKVYYYRGKLKYRRELLKRLNLFKVKIRQFFLNPISIIVLSGIVIYFLLLLLF